MTFLHHLYTKSKTALKRQNAFTLVELIIVITIIGILATISVVGFSRFQTDARDAQRASKTAVIAEALEKYYDKNGEYPSCSDVSTSAATVMTATLEGIDSQVLIAPLATTGETNSIKCADIATAPDSEDYFAYVGDSSTACSTGLACLQFTLQYREEGTSNIISIESRRRTEIATSGVPTVTATTTGFTTATVTWTAVNNAVGYTLQRATDAAFTNNLVATSHSGASTNVTGLAYNTTYFFRVQANALNSDTTWSNTDSIATWVLTTPTLTTTANSMTQVTADWTDVVHATSYGIEYSTSSTFASGVTASTATTSTKTITGLAAGTTYYFRVQGVNGTQKGAWATKSLTTPQLATPSAAATANSLSQVTVDWSDITYATSYDINYSTSSSFTTSTTATSTTSSRAITGLSGNTTYYFRVRAVAPADTSSWSATVTRATLAIGTPTITATTNSASQITVDWSDITYASSYTINYSTASNFSPTSTTTSTTSTKAIGGLNGGTTYYFRVQAVASADTGNWSGTKSATTTASNPSGTPTVSAGMASSTVARGTAGSAGSCSAGMSMAYQLRYHSTNVAADGSWSGWTDGTTRDVTALQGNKYTFQVQARCVGSDTSSGYDVSGTASTVRSISTPPAPGWAITTEWAAGYNYNMSYSWSCPSGTSIGPDGVSSNSGGASKPTPWVDWWYLGWNAGEYDSWHTYNAQYTCQTAYTSANSPVTSTQIHVSCSAGRRSFSSYPRCDNYGQGQGGNGNGNY